MLITRVKGTRKLWGGGAATSHEPLGAAALLLLRSGEKEQPDNANIPSARAAMC